MQDFGDGTVHWRHRYDPENDRCVSVVERRDAADATCWRETHIQYAVDAGQLHELAAAAGMRVERVRDLEHNHYSPAAFTHVWRLRKEARWTCHAWAQQSTHCATSSAPTYAR
ncbi:hypothetical protein ACU635_61100 [[Actinomadura] parvosata]|uniref:hypothetical protein n=1 Tax=[Actinomadura] parvosata TaxID=1955412 RepID=UPI00406C32EF